MLRFAQALNAFRRRQPNVRRGAFLTGKASKPGQLPDVSWFNPDGKVVNWNTVGSSLTCVFGTTGVNDPAARAVLIMLHSGSQPQEFTPPPAAANLKWRLFIDTAAQSPGDIYPDADGPPLGRDPVLLDAKTLRCYVAE
jgi:glycogen operon protein